MEIKGFRADLHNQTDNFINRDTSTVLVDMGQLYSEELLTYSLERKSLSQIREEDEFFQDFERTQKTLKMDKGIVNLETLEDEMINKIDNELEKDFSGNT